MRGGVAVALAVDVARERVDVQQPARPHREQLDADRCGDAAHASAPGLRYQRRRGLVHVHWRGFEERDAEIARRSSDLDAANGRLEGANVEIAQLRSNLDAANERLKGEEFESNRRRAELALLTSELSSEEDGRAALDAIHS